jgi:hypothetical protein|tara:strand:- start:1616 stop:2257 length:642 start_codon:yes stop_codon:yes gene_type:complete
MKPTNLLKYWSNRPLDKNQFLAMIHRDYNIVFSKDTALLMDYLYQSQGQLPAVVEFSQKEIDENNTFTENYITIIKFLIYSSHDTGGPIGEIDTSLNPRAPSDITAPRYITSDMTEQQSDTLCSGWECTGISNYEDGGEEGIEIEFERLMVRVWEDEQQWASANYSLRAYLQNVAGGPLDTAEVYGYMLYKTQEYIQLEYRKSSIQSLNYPPR